MRKRSTLTGLSRQQQTKKEGKSHREACDGWAGARELEIEVQALGMLEGREQWRMSRGDHDGRPLSARWD